MNLYLFCRKGLVLLALILFPVLVTGMGDPDYTMSFSDEAAPQGGAVSVNFSFNHQAPSGVQGFSFGVCHDPSVLTHEAEGASSNFDYVANWSNNVEQLKQGGPPDFFQQNEESGGWTVGCVICFTSCDVLAAGTYNFGSANYRLTGPVGTITQVGLCNTLGSPAVTSVAVVQGASMGMDSIDGTIEILEQPPILFQFTAPENRVNYDPADGAASFSADLSITEDQTNPTYPTSTQGFSMSISTDTSYVTPSSADVAGVVATLNPAFSQAQLTATGWTIGVVYAFQLPVYLEFASETTAVEITGDTVPGALIGDNTGLTIPLHWESLSGPPIHNVVTVNNDSLTPILQDGHLELNPQTIKDYKRGDSNGDGIVNVADAIWSLQEIFNNGPEGTCFDAKNSNGDGLYDIGDPIWLISYIFSGGAAPPQPGPTTCGNDGEPQLCETYDGC
ncbi:MAG: hypothetical protein AAEJ04_10130 [Planctomycetota bacterium]